MPFIDDLSNIGRPLFEEVNNGYTPFEFLNLTEGMVTFDSRDMGAFNLPIAGMGRDLTREHGIEIQPDGDRFILRIVVGYAMALRCVENPTRGCIVISNLINQMLSAAYRVYGPRILTLSFDRPNSANYFTELENSTGFDLRLYGKLQPHLEFEMEVVE